MMAANAMSVISAWRLSQPGCGGSGPTGEARGRVSEGERCRGAHPRLGTITIERIELAVGVAVSKRHGLSVSGTGSVRRSETCAARWGSSGLPRLRVDHYQYKFGRYTPLAVGIVCSFRLQIGVAADALSIYTPAEDSYQIAI